MFRPVIQRIFIHRSGVTSLEYALIAGLVAMAIIGGLSVVGVQTNGAFVHANRLL
ncbi:MULTISPECIES: Flp family type IVb pilin [Acidiphilium]|uniref:Flp family type IVb pilin n=1 Tax=Acidiphilium TaxID=522 RepID=UPI0009DCEF4C